MTGESGPEEVHVRMRLARTADTIVWSWTLGRCTVSLSYPVPEDGGDASDIDKDLTTLVYQLPELVESGVIEADVHLSMQELEGELDELSAEDR